MVNPTRLFDFPQHQLENNPLEVSICSMVDGKWKSYSSQEYIDHANWISYGLMKMGVKPGDKIGLISHNNRCEWNIMDIGSTQIGAVDVPVYANMSEDDYNYVLNHAEVKYVFVSNQDLYDKVAAVKSKVPSIVEVFSFEKLANVKHWLEVLELGKSVEKENPGIKEELQRIKDGISKDDLATLIYTSGTTGLPKGVMLSHWNLVSNSLYSAPKMPNITIENPKSLSFLPVCHVFERMLQYLYSYTGVSIYFAQSIETIKEDLNYVQPQMFAAVPRLLEKFFDGIVAKGTAAGGVKSKLFAWAVALALEWEPNGANGGMYEFKLKLARKLVFSKVKAALGMTGIEAVVSGGAALQPRLARFFNGAGITVLEGYGLTETSPVITVNTVYNNGIRIGTVGRLIDNNFVKIAEDGEILTKGPNVMQGYYKEPEKTAEVMTGEWFHTGDIGMVDDDGFLKITDRKKQMFKTSGGKYIAPQPIENGMKESHLIEQAMVIGDGKKFPAALIVAFEDGMKEWAKRHDIKVSTYSEMITNEEIIGKMERDINKINERLGKWEQIKKFKIVPEPFSVEGGELTPTMKLRRKPILKKYGYLVDEIYDC